MKKLFATLLACTMAFTCAVPAFAAGGKVEMFSTPGQRGMIADPLDIAWIYPLGDQLSLGTIKGVHVIEKDSKIVVTNTFNSIQGAEEEFFSIFLRVYEPKKSGATAIQYDPDTDTETVVDISDYMTSIGVYNLIKVEEDSLYEYDKGGIPFDNTKHWRYDAYVESGFDSYNLEPGKSIEIELPDWGDGYAYAVGINHSYHDGDYRYEEENDCIFVTEDEKIGTFIKDKEAETTVNNDKTETAKPSNFKDVADNAYYADAVKWAVENGITSGTSATTFSPNNTCTRAQILTFLWKANGSPVVSAGNPFTDVKESDYFYNAARWAYANGIIEGKTFAGNTPCTRSSTVDYMYKAAGRPSVAVTNVFTDVSANADYAKAVAWALENGITGGTSDTTFSPDNTCTRGQIVSFLYRNYANKNEAVQDEFGKELMEMMRPYVFYYTEGKKTGTEVAWNSQDRTADLVDIFCEGGFEGRSKYSFIDEDGNTGYFYTDYNDSFYMEYNEVLGEFYASDIPMKDLPDCLLSADSYLVYRLNGGERWQVPA